MFPAKAGCSIYPVLPCSEAWTRTMIDGARIRRPTIRRPRIKVIWDRLDIPQDIFSVRYSIYTR